MQILLSRYIAKTKKTETAYISEICHGSTFDPKLNGTNALVQPYP